MKRLDLAMLALVGFEELLAHATHVTGRHVKDAIRILQLLDFAAFDDVVTEQHAKFLPHHRRVPGELAAIDTA